MTLRRKFTGSKALKDQYLTSKPFMVRHVTEFVSFPYNQICTKKRLLGNLWYPVCFGNIALIRRMCPSFLFY